MHDQSDPPRSQGSALLFLRKPEPAPSGARQLVSCVAGYACGAVAYSIAWTVCLLFERLEKRADPKKNQSPAPTVTLPVPTGDRLP